MAEVVDVLLRARMEASGVETGVNQIKNSLKGLTLPKGITDDLEKSFSKLTPLLKDYQKQLNKGFSNKRDLQNFNALKEKIDEVFVDIKTQVQRANSEQIRLKVDTQEIDKLEKQLTSKSAELQKALNSIFEGKTSTENITSGLDKVLSKSARATTIKPMVNMAKTLFQNQDFSAYNQKIDEMRNKILSLSSTKLDLARALNFKGASDNIEEIDKRINKFFNSLKVNSGKVETVERLKRELKDIGVNLDNVKMDSLTRGATELQGLEGVLDGLVSGFKQTGAAATEAGNGMVRMSEEVNQLKTSTQYFFSLRNMINLLKRGIQEAVQTVKELDAAMTETAVVTDFSVADMWSFLPEYTAMANKLGATIKGAYETTTLYYQQGLDKEAAFGIGEETIKMARIAGLDYAETTDMMTAALRGFNMELNNLSAQHINDVYSELAAKTASNTQEIGSAMERTASIAHSAGMSFEGTSAFLAQMIETTREAPENLGTAMKTIIARFQELKKDPMDMEEVDGELPDYNKVDTALKSIGVNLKNQRGEFRALDDVFLDIAKRWDDLDQRQQRYVATTAAGSRQQSRFIAMMNNYSRTAELMEYANNSAGASQEQFNKTLDSFEAKANKLRNAWDRFLMGITDNQIIKGGLDILTNLVEGINNLIETVSGGFGPLKSFLSLFTAFTGLKLGGGLVNRLIGGLGGLLDPNSSAKQGFKIGATGFNSAQTVSPIVSVLEQIRNEVTAIKTKNENQDNAETNEKVRAGDYWHNYKTANKEFRSTIKGGKTIDNVLQTLAPTDEKQSQLIFNNSPGVKKQLKKTFNKVLENSGLDAEMTQAGRVAIDQLFTGMSKGSISTKQGIKSVKNLSNLGELVGTQEAKQFSKAYNKTLIQEAEKRKGNFEKGARRAFGYKNATDDQWEAYKSQNTDKVNQAIKEARDKYIASLSEKDIPIEKATAAEKLANGVSHVGSTFTTAGQAVSSFGMALSNLGLDSAGAAFMTLGNTISSVGMTISSLSGMITNPAFWAIAIPTAAITGITVYRKHLETQAKEAAEEITKTYNDTIDETTKKISTLESNRDILNSLSSGVDQFGNNVSLTNDEYEQFLAASKEIAEVSPSLIKGYTAQGDALVATGQALDDVIAKQKEYQELAKETYVSSTSLETLANGEEVTDTFKKYKNPYYYYTSAKNGDAKNIWETTKSSTDFNYLSNQIENLRFGFSQLGMSVEDAEAAIKHITGVDIDLFNVSLEDAQVLGKYYHEIEGYTLELYDEIAAKEKEAGDISQEQIETRKTNFKNAMGEWASGWSDLNKEAQELTDAISQYLTSEGLDAKGLELSEEFVYGFNEGLSQVSLQAIMTDDISGTDIQKMARDYANGYKNLIGEGTEYAKIMDVVTEKQEEFLEDIGNPDAVENYNKSVASSVEAMREMADNIDTSTLAGEQLQAVLYDTANTIENYASEVQINLSESLNSLSHEFEHARSAKEEFDKAIEGGDYYTAAEGFKGIYDEITNDKNALGNGSQTFWTGAESLLGEDTLEEVGYDIDEVRKKIKELGPVLDEGAEGFNNFIKFLYSKEGTEGLEEFITFGEDGIEFNIEDQELEDLADILDVDVDLLAAMVDKARQYANIDLHDPTKTRAALMEDDRVMQGQNDKLYISDDVFKTEAKNAGYTGEGYKELKEELQKNNVAILKAEDLLSTEKDGISATNSLLRDLGLNTGNSLSDAVQVFSRMGFSLEDTKNILSREGIIINGSEEDVEKAWQESALALENPTVAQINSSTTGILDNTTAMLTAMGIMTDSLKEQVKDVANEKEVDGLVDKLVSKEIDENGKTTYRTNTFHNTEAHDTARSNLETRLTELETLEQTLTQGMNKATDESVKETFKAELDKVTTLKQEAEEALLADEESWNGKLEDIRSKYKNWDKLGANETDQGYIDTHAMEINNMLSNVDETNIIDTLTKLQSLKDTGELTKDTVRNLAKELFNLNEIDLSSLDQDKLNALLNSLGFMDIESGKVYDNLYAISGLPFETPRLNSDELLQQIDQIETELGGSQLFNLQEREIIFSTTLTGDQDRISQLLDQINTQFGGTGEDAQIKKSVIIEATAKIATGDAEGARSLLQDTFGDDAETIEQQLTFICSGSIGNESEVKGALEEQAKSLTDGVEVDTSIIQKIGFEQPKPVTVTANPDPALSTIKALSEEIAASTASMNVDANTTLADEKINDILVKATGPAYLSVYPVLKGSITGGKLSAEPLAKGRNNTLPTQESVSFNSFAGGYNGPGRKGSKITALTGEKGYEVAWIPSENRSTILGENGPEIATFPADTVIYNHKQSKKILKGNQNKLNLGSFAYAKGKLKPVDTDNYFSSSSSSSGSSKGSSSSSGSSKGSNSSKSDSKEEKHITINNFSIEEVIRFDIERKIENYQNKVDNWMKSLDKSLGKIGIKVSDVTSNISNQISYLKSVKNQNDNLAASYQRSLKELDTGNYTTTISYDNNGESKQEDVNLSPYIYKDQWGNYQIDQNKIKNAGSKQRQEAIFKAAESALGSLVSGLIKAQNAAQEAADAIEELQKKIYDTFWGWKNEITEIYNLSQKLSVYDAQRNRFSAQVALESARIATGFSDIASSFTNATAALKRNNDTIREQIKANRDMVAARERELNNALSATDELQLYTAVWEKNGRDSNNAAVKEAKKQYDAALLMRKYLPESNITRNKDGGISYTINQEQFENDRLNGKISQETYNLIKEQFDHLEDSATSFNDVVKDGTELISSFYEDFLEYQKAVADLEDELLKELERELQEEIDSSKKLNDTIKNSLKDLLDEVKRKLDERRQKEDNEKTERDLANKQQRLALLRASTSGSQVEIAQLEKELADAEQSYQRTLEDQLLNKLQQQGDAAAKQRERQIAIAEAQLELSSSSNRALVSLWLSDPIAYQDAIAQALRGSRGYDEKGEYGQIVLDNEIKKDILETSEAVHGIKEGIGAVVNEMENGMGSSDSDKNYRENSILQDFTYRNTNDEEGANPANWTTAKAFKSKGNSVKEAQDTGKSEGRYYIGADGNKYAGFSFSELKQGGYSNAQLRVGGYGLADFWANNIVKAVDLKAAGFTAKQLLDFVINGKHPYTTSNLKGIYTDAELGIKTTTSSSSSKASTSTTKTLTNDDIVGIASAIWNWGSSASGWGYDQTRWNNIDRIFGAGAGQKVQDYINAHAASDSGWYSIEKSKKYFRNKYKKGGLAPFTGPAWLDGTKSKPELVLNATDTKNFIQLKDILSSVMKGGAFDTAAAVAGDTNYEININVDHINNDYDVDKIANRVKKIIVQDSSYRNVTSVRKFR